MVLNNFQTKYCMLTEPRFMFRIFFYDKKKSSTRNCPCASVAFPINVLAQFSDPGFGDLLRGSVFSAHIRFAADHGLGGHRTPPDPKLLSHCSQFENGEHYNSNCSSHQGLKQQNTQITHRKQTLGLVDSCKL